MQVYWGNISQGGVQNIAFLDWRGEGGGVRIKQYCFYCQNWKEKYGFEWDGKKAVHLSEIEYWKVTCVFCV